jgi:hypothetical protein
VAEGSIRLNHERDWRPFANGGFPTPSGKAHLWSDDLRKWASNRFRCLVKSGRRNRASCN